MVSGTRGQATSDRDQNPPSRKSMKVHLPFGSGEMQRLYFAFENCGQVNPVGVPRSRQLGREVMGSAEIRGPERKLTTVWRRGWDSNPRDPFGPNGFQDRRSQPLSYPSETKLFGHCTLRSRFGTIRPTIIALFNSGLRSGRSICVVCLW